MRSQNRKLSTQNMGNVSYTARVPERRPKLGDSAEGHYLGAAYQFVFVRRMPPLPRIDTDAQRNPCAGSDQIRITT